MKIGRVHIGLHFGKLMSSYEGQNFNGDYRLYGISVGTFAFGIMKAKHWYKGG